MAYVKVPKDLRVIKERVAFGLTKRQLVCFVLAAVAGFPVFFILKSIANIDIAIITLMLIAFPFMLAAWYEKDGLNFEEYAILVYRHKYWQRKYRLYISKPPLLNLTRRKEKRGGKKQ